MKFHGLTESLIDGTTTIRILRVIVGRPQRQFTGRELAFESGTAPSKAILSLKRLAAQGLVSVREAGRSHQWQIRSDHALIPALRAWFHSEARFPSLVAEKLVQGLGPEPSVQKAVVFGSFARHEERPNSDIDVFVVVKEANDKDRVSAVLRPIQLWTYTTFGNPLKPVIYSEAELRQKRGSTLIRNIEREGLVVLERPSIKTKKIDRSKAAAYLLKAQEFADSMEQAASGAKWNAVGLNAVHTVISAVDAATVHCFGARSREQDHEQVYELLRRIPDPDAVSKADQAVQVIERKNLVEYETRLFDETEGRALADKAKRFLRWVKKILARPP